MKKIFPVVLGIHAVIISLLYLWEEINFVGFSVFICFLYLLILRVIRWAFHENKKTVFPLFKFSMKTSRAPYMFRG
jgi:transposase